MLNTSREIEPRVAHAVDEDAARGIEAAHVGRVAGAGGAVLAQKIRAHAGGVAQGLGQGGGGLLAHDMFLDDGNGLRRVEQRCRVLGIGGGVGLVVDHAGALHLNLLEGVGGRLRACRQRNRRRQGGRRGAAQLRKSTCNGVLAAPDVGHGGSPENDKRELDWRVPQLHLRASEEGIGWVSWRIGGAGLRIG